MQLFAKQNYIQYHKDIIGAERLFLANRFDSSLKVYKKIFNEYPKPFAKDCFTALQIACMIQDTACARYFFGMSFRRGVDWDALKLVGCIKDMLARDDVVKRVTHLYPSERAYYYRSIDTALRNYVVSLWQKDAANHTNKFRVKGFSSTISDSLATIAYDENIRAFKSFCSKWGYPGEAMIGILDDKEYRSGSIVRLLFSSIPAILFFHHHYGFPIIKEYLLKAIIDGELQPREYALIYEWSYTSIAAKHSVETNKKKYPKMAEKYGSPLFKYQVIAEHPPRDRFYNIDIKPTYYCSDTLLVNNDREEIGISTLQHDMAKQFFAKKHNLVLFYGLFARY